MIQTRDHGKHDISPAAAQADRAGLPVTMPRQSESDMCRARPSTASPQSDAGADEHGRLRGVSDLNRSFADRRVLASNRVPILAMEENWLWRRRPENRSQIRLRDKSGSPVASQALERARFSTCLAVGARAARSELANNYSFLSGTIVTRAS